jgi:hypothetical protein
MTPYIAGYLIYIPLWVAYGLQEFWNWLWPRLDAWLLKKWGIGGYEPLHVKEPKP